MVTWNWGVPFTYTYIYIYIILFMICYPNWWWPHGFKTLVNMSTMWLQWIWISVLKKGQKRFGCWYSTTIALMLTVSLYFCQRMPSWLIAIAHSWLGYDLAHPLQESEMEIISKKARYFVYKILDDWLALTLLLLEQRLFFGTKGRSDLMKCSVKYDRLTTWRT